MARKSLTEPEKLKLEVELVDKYDLQAVLLALAKIAYAKADHVLVTWNDKPLAREWVHDARALEKLAFDMRSSR